MSYSLLQIRRVVESLWPSAGAEPWDAPGLITGNNDSIVSRIVLAVDAVGDTVDEAVALDADLLLVHHPLLLRGVTTIAEEGYKGSLLSRLIRAECALIAAHTNADVVEHGVSAVIADRLGLQGVVPIAAGQKADQGIGRVGSLAQPTTLGRLARTLGALLPATATGIRASGDFDQPVSRVALCGGAGDSLLAEPAVRSADVYITSDLRHHPASESREQSKLGGGPALVDVSHWASEWLWLETAAQQLAEALPALSITISELRTDPWDFTVVQ